MNQVLFRNQAPNLQGIFDAFNRLAKDLESLNEPAAQKADNSLNYQKKVVW